MVNLSVCKNGKLAYFGSNLINLTRKIRKGFNVGHEIKGIDLRRLVIDDVGFG
jgi:hypothetical protein